MNAVKIEITPEEKASRMELLIRFIYMIPLFVVLWVLSIVMQIAVVVNFITSLILGKRIQALSNFVVLGVKYQTQVMVYLFLTDERPEIMPKM